MARKQVVEVQCDRCSRVEHAPEEQLARKITIEVTGQEPVVFEDLCTPCWKTVNNHLEQACKKIEGVSPDRKVTPADELPLLAEKAPAGRRRKVEILTVGVDPMSYPDERQLSED